MEPISTRFGTVLVVDPVDLLRRGLRATLQDEAQHPVKVVDAASLEIADDWLARDHAKANLIVLGPQMVDRGDELLEFRQRHEDVPFALLVDRLDDVAAICGYALDVIGIVDMGATPREVREAVACMLSGHVYLPRSVRPYLNPLIFDGCLEQARRKSAGDFGAPMSMWRERSHD